MYRFDLVLDEVVVRCGIYYGFETDLDLFDFVKTVRNHEAVSGYCFLNMTQRHLVLFRILL